MFWVNNLRQFPCFESTSDAENFETIANNGTNLVQKKELNQNEKFDHNYLLWTDDILFLSDSDSSSEDEENLLLGINEQNFETNENETT